MYRNLNYFSNGLTPASYEHAFRSPTCPDIQYSMTLLNARLNPCIASTHCFEITLLSHVYRSRRVFHERRDARQSDIGRSSRKNCGDKAIYSRTGKTPLCKKGSTSLRYIYKWYHFHLHWLSSDSAEQAAALQLLCASLACSRLPPSRYTFLSALRLLYLSPDRSQAFYLPREVQVSCMTRAYQSRLHGADQAGHTVEE
jgi:hypothetical protein